jgi:ATP-dependent helicase HrpA
MTESAMSDHKNLNIQETIKAQRIADIPRITYPESLPVTAKRNDIIKAIKRHKVVVITGDTGSGKTTQIPKMCLEAGRGIFGVVGCTQPRRVAAITVAHRIAEELGEEVGRSVGYQVRFEDRSSRNNYIKIMTDGILLNEVQNDRYLRRYDTIIVDEAHERSLNIDFVLGTLKTLLQKRNDLKVIITSATIDTEKFSRAFHAPIIEVTGRMYPVELLYKPIDVHPSENEEFSHIDACVNALQTVYAERHGGDVLIFMPTEQDIRETCDLIKAKLNDDTDVLPLFARLPWTEQRRVFQPSDSRKIVVATNIAETSITIPGIRYVIDAGLARISQYNPRSRTTSLPVKDISRSSADQRKGRCGRVQNGVCIRLYSKDDYEDRPLFTEPEVLRSNLAEVILRMLSLRIGDIASFPFIDPPPPKHIRDGIEILRELGAIEISQRDDRTDDFQKFSLTERGKMMARLPIDPRISRMIIEARQEGCVKDILIIAAALSVQDPRERPPEFEKEADKIHAVFSDPSSDFMTLLRIWNQFHDLKRANQSKSRLKKFCKEHYLSFRRMREWTDVYDQLHEILEEQKWSVGNSKKLDDKLRYEAIHRSVLSGYLSNIANKNEKNIYHAAKGKEVMIFPGSTLFNRGGNWIVAAEMIETSRLFARITANIESDWLEKLAGDLCRSTYSEPHWSKDRGEVLAYEQVSLFGLVIIPKRPVSFGRIHPEEAAEIFRRCALVEGTLKKSPPFLTHNLEVINTISTMENKIRRRNLLASEDELADFYASRIPGIYDLQTLMKRIKDEGNDDFLRMKEEDVLQHFPPEDIHVLYPDAVAVGSKRLSCVYRFNPGKSDDGVTVKVPVHILPGISEQHVHGQVPGVLAEKVEALLKALPKEFRKKLLPLPHVRDTILSALNASEDFLLSVMSKVIYEKFGVDIPASSWKLDAISDHLNIRYAVIDEKGRIVSSGRDITALQNEIVTEMTSSAFIRAQKTWEKDGLKEWSFGDLPEVIVLGEKSDPAGYAYPALQASDGCVNIRLFKNRADAEKSHRNGIRELYAIHFNNDLKYLMKTIVLKGDIKNLTDAIGQTKEFEKYIYERVLNELLDHPTRNPADFNRHAKQVASNILPAGQDILNRFTPLMKGYCDIVMKIRSLETANRSNKPALEYLGDIKKDLGQLMPKEFLLQYNDDRIPDILRYLKSVAMRAERGLVHLEKAWLKTNAVKIFIDRYQNLISSFTLQTSDVKKDAVEELKWMIEEYKISVFSQEIKTAYSISEKRLEKKINEIERMA